MNAEKMTWRPAVMEMIRREALPVDKYGHQPRLYELTRAIGEGLNYDDDIVFAAVWLHDLGVFVGHRPEDPAALAAWDNVIYAMRRAPELLARIGFPESKIAAVVEAIRTHQSHLRPEAIEGVILRDADILEQLGAITILRTVSKVGRDTRYKTFSEVIPLMQHALDTLPQLLRLPAAQAMAAPRVLLLRQFIEAVKAEAGEGLY